MELSADEIRELVLGYASGAVADHVAAAFLMAAFINGLSDDETSEMTRAMVDSGVTLPLRAVGRPKVDKHSTGGVSDGVTLVFAPLAASLGLAVAKLSGRGLGHTGGTLDKLESIPGFRVELSGEELERQVEAVGCAVAAQSKDLVPADGALYALRDATATVPSIPLIAASVMSKKLAVHTDLILLDVKAGSGAFMKTPEAARDLAEACTRLAGSWGRPCRAAVTDMSQPLGRAVGNALEVAEAVSVLRGEGGGRLRELSVIFATRAQELLLRVPQEEARDRAVTALDRGAAASSLQAMVDAQGGDPAVVEEPGRVLPKAPVQVEVKAREGYLGPMDAEALGRVAVTLGAGRTRKGQPVDPAVGFEFYPKVGDRIDQGEPIAVVHARDEAGGQHAAQLILRAISITDDPVVPPSLVHGWTGGN
jgi:pyrimidine-nucleoside phosphorylase